MTLIKILKRICPKIDHSGIPSKISTQRLKKPPILTCCFLKKDNFEYVVDSQ